jgi:hypothetical protein
VGGVAEATSYVSSTQVAATIPAEQLESGSQLPVIALNGTVSSGAGAAGNLQVTNPAPTISQLFPAVLAVGTVSPVVAVTGTGYVPATVIDVNGSARPTAFVSAAQVNVTLTATDAESAGSLTLAAVNAAPGGGTSAATTVMIDNPAPGMSIALAPTTVPTSGATPTTVMVTGTNFIPASTVEVNGAGRATNYASATQLTFQLTVADEATSQALSVTVVNPTPGGGTSAAAALEILALAQTPPPVILQVYPSQILVGSGATTITVDGSNLYAQLSSGQTVLTSTVLWNGTPLTAESFGPDGNGASYILALAPASLLTAVGTATVTVSSATSTPAMSNAATVSIVNPPTPTLTSITPNAGPTGTATTVTLNGTGFTANSTVAMNGTNIAAAYISSTELTVTISASSVMLPGNLLFTVTTPAPGGGTTAPLTYTAYIGIVNNSMIYNPVNGLIYVSVPSSAGAPYGNSVVSVDPETGALGTPIAVGSEPDRLAVTADGQYLWVGLDGASAVQMVNLATGTAGLQFSLGGNAGLYAPPPTVLALAALPGAENSVVVATSGGSSVSSLAIYDSGIPRGTAVTGYSANTTYALQANGTTNEIYAGQGGSYTVYTYSASGLTQEATASNGTYTGTSNDDMQVEGGQTYTDYGAVYDAEAGTLLGAFYASGTAVAAGPTVADTTLGLVFILDSPQGSGATYGYSQIQSFDIAEFNPASTAVIPVGVSTSAMPSHLTRWGTNGLAFQTGDGVYSLRSNLVKDLSSVFADLGTTLTASGGITTGTNTKYTATVTNAGPSAATNVALTVQLPATGVPVSAMPSSGTCAAVSGGVNCDLGGLASGATATVTMVATQTTAGSVTAAVEVSGSENDPNESNNQASATLTVTGSMYNRAPTLSAISPAAIQSGSGDTVITVTGAGFSSASSVLLGGAALSTNYTNSTTLTATAPAAQLASLGWAAITVSNPAPGGGVSSALPLSVYSVIALGANHILYDPYSRKIMASVGSGSTTVVGNSIVAITPETATVGTAAPIGSQPTNLALTSDGQLLYTILSGSESVALFNMLTQTAEYTYAVPAPPNAISSVALRGIATQPGTENTIALDLGEDDGDAIYDFNPVTQTAAIRGQNTGPDTGSCIVFPDAGDLLAFDIDTSGATFNHYTVTAAGFTSFDNSQYTESTLNEFGCFKTSGAQAFAVLGGVANYSASPATQQGAFSIPSNDSNFGLQDVAPDISLGLVFFAVNGEPNSSAVDSIAAYDSTTYLPSETMQLDFAAIEGTAPFGVPDLIRWGQDGLAVLTSNGNIYLLRGPFVVPQLLNQNSAANLASSSVTTIAHGAGNTLFTLTGTNFVPGVAVTWNGSYRTTTIMDATHVTVAIPASDLANTGSGSLVAANPGAPASNTLTVTIY